MELANKTVIVTGATGLIGSHLVKALIDRGNINVIAISRNEQKLKKGFSCYLNNSRFRLYAMDVSEPFPNFEEPIDFIFHAAGPMEGKIIANFPVDVINPNLIGTMNCLELLRKSNQRYGNKGRIVIFSSVTVYSNNTSDDRTVSELDTNVTEVLESGSAPYSQSKRMVEVIARAYQKQFGLDVVIARLSTVYGNTIFKPDTAFYQFINSVLNKENIIMKKKGIGRRDNIFIEDAVDALLTICERGITGEAYNVSSNGDMNNYAAVDEIAGIIANQASELLGLDYTLSVDYKDLTDFKRRPGLKLDNNKLKNLGWSIKHELNNSIKQIIKEIMLERDI